MMPTSLSDLYYNLQIKAWLAFKPAVLFDKINHLPWYRETLQQWSNDLELDSGTSLLEAGCSTGLLTNYLYQQGFNVIGADKSPAMISKAQSNFPALNFHEENIFELSFENHRFDAVIAASLLNIVPDKAKALAEMVRVCKQGGKVSIFVPIQGFSPDDLNALSQDLKAAQFSKAALKAWYRLPPKMLVDDVITLFEEAGLSKPTPITYLNGMVAGFTGVKD